MPRRRRDRTAGLVFHVLNRAAKRAVLFENPRDYAALEGLMEEDGALSRFMHWLETTHARRWQSTRGLAGLGAVYQGRFKAIPIQCSAMSSGKKTS